jgi:hypothetical protein
VYLKKDVPLGFSKLLGFAKSTVRVQAAAAVVPLGAASGLVPIGIEDTKVLNYGTIEILKFDEKSNNNYGYGWYGILNMDGKGGSTYRDLLVNGSTTTFAVDDVLQTIFGNKVGPTSQGIQARLARCSYEDCSLSNPDSPRIILVPVYHRNVDYGKTNNVTIVGFASFYITDFQDNVKQITGQFLRKIVTGPTRPGTVDDGTYGIKLIE